MPDVRNCKRCGKIFNYIGGLPLCQPCKDLDEEDFKRIKEYLYTNHGASLSVVSVELDVPVEKIRRFLKEGRLEILGNESNFVLECEGCGKSINTGRYCGECEKDLTMNLKSAANKLTTSVDEKSKAAKNKFEIRYLKDK